MSKKAYCYRYSLLYNAVAKSSLPVVRYLSEEAGANLWANEENKLLLLVLGSRTMTNGAVDGNQAAVVLVVPLVKSVGQGGHSLEKWQKYIRVQND